MVFAIIGQGIHKGHLGFILLPVQFKHSLGGLIMQPLGSTIIFRHVQQVFIISQGFFIIPDGFIGSCPLIVDFSIFGIQFNGFRIIDNGIAGWFILLLISPR